MDLLLDKMPLFLLFPMLSPGFGDKGLSAKTQPPWFHKAGLQFNLNRVSGVGRLRPSSEPIVTTWLSSECEQQRD